MTQSVSTIAYSPHTESPSREMPTAMLSDLACEVLAKGTSFSSLFAQLESCEWNQQCDFCAFLDAAYQRQFLRIVSKLESPSFAMEPRSATAVPGITEICKGHLKLSRFAFLGPQSIASCFFAESATGQHRVLLLRDKATSLLQSLVAPISTSEVIKANRKMSSGEVIAALQMLAAAGIVISCSADGQSTEDSDTAMRQWEFHDLLFHSRSRVGSTTSAVGATYRFKNDVNPPPVVREAREGAERLPLYSPSLNALAATDPSFTAVVESRRSIRTFGNRPISIQTIGEFLYRLARVKNVFSNGDIVLSSRPYPSGGASYECEMYITSNYCDGLPRGFYHYDPSTHELEHLSTPCPDMEGLLADAWTASAGTCIPQILITLSSRFQRVSWKYEGMAYATQLKNIGVLYAHMYLLATAMGLGCCAFGLGNTERFCRLAETDYYREGSIGEFAIGAL
jgi:SagB-type dehydrogenase family enzyme